MKIDEISEILSKNVLFAGLDKKRISYLVSLCTYRLENLCKDSIIYDENEKCDSLGFVLDGSVNISKLNPDGSVMTIRNVGIGGSFGDAILFSSDEACHSTIITSSISKILFISDKDLLNIGEVDPLVLKNFLRNLSDRIMFLSKKIRLLSYQSVRQRINHFLLEEYQSQNSDIITLNLTREELGELLDIARPSISRELSKMEKDGLISVKGRKISIIDLEKIKKSLESY